MKNEGRRANIKLSAVDNLNIIVYEKNKMLLIKG